MDPRAKRLAYESYVESLKADELSRLDRERLEARRREEKLRESYYGDDDGADEFERLAESEDEVWDPWD